MYAQEDTWLGKSLSAVGRFLDHRAKFGLDTTFLAAPKCGWMVSVTSSFAGVKPTVTGEDLPTYGDINIYMRSGLSGNLALALGYRGFSVRYALNFAKGYSRNLNLAYLGRSFGIEFRRYATDGLHGYIDASATPKIAQVEKGDTRLRATIIDGYYVFNCNHYSLPSAMGSGLIQKRSSGSVTAYGLYLNADLTAQNEMLGAMLGGIKKIEIYQAALGLGYGYNYTPNGGRLLVHLSAAPMVVFFTRNFITADVSFPLQDGSAYKTEILKSIEPKHRLFLTGIARASVIYNLNDHLDFSVNALLNDVQFSSTIDLKVGMKDWVVNGRVCVRF